MDWEVGNIAVEVTYLPAVRRGSPTLRSLRAKRFQRSAAVTQFSECRENNLARLMTPLQQGFEKGQGD